MITIFKWIFKLWIGIFKVLFVIIGFPIVILKEILKQNEIAHHRWGNRRRF